MAKKDIITKYNKNLTKNEIDFLETLQDIDNKFVKPICQFFINYNNEYNDNYLINRIIDIMNIENITDNNMEYKFRALLCLKDDVKIKIDHFWDKKEQEYIINYPENDKFYYLFLNLLQSKMIEINNIYKLRENFFHYHPMKFLNC